MNYIPISSASAYGIDEEKRKHIAAILELVQNRLQIKKGSFPLDPNLGSELYKLCGINGNKLVSKALTYVKEALSVISEVTVTEVSTSQKADVLELNIQMVIENTPVETQVTL